MQFILGPRTLLLSYYFLITVLFCSSTHLVFVTGVSSCHLRTILILPQNYLITVLLCSSHIPSVSEEKIAINLEQSYCCLGTILLTQLLYNSPLCTRRNQPSSQNNLFTLFELSYYSLITVLFCSSTYLHCIRGQSSYNLRIVL